MAPSTHQARPGGYFERLRTPWWWYLGAVGVSVLLGLEFAVAVSGWLAWVPFAIVLPASLLVVWRLSSGSIALDGGTLQAGERSVAVADIEQAIDLSATELRRLVGRHGDPLAFTYIRSWVGPGVQLLLRQPAVLAPDGPSPDDEAGPQSEPDGTPRYPEPYWVVSTRHPDRLLAALRTAAPAG
jgi:hypothetical protein